MLTLGDRVVGVRVLAATGQAGLLVIRGDGGNGQQDKAFCVRSCLTKLDGRRSVRRW